jgi:hypothetical protein
MKVVVEAVINTAVTLGEQRMRRSLIVCSGKPIYRQHRLVVESA